jgi:hypothetical protein
MQHRLNAVKNGKKKSSNIFVNNFNLYLRSKLPVPKLTGKGSVMLKPSCPYCGKYI